MVELAKSAGFCFGVKRAVDTVYNLSNDKEKVYTLGPIIHNEEVVKDLKNRGVDVVETPDDIKSKDSILVIRSHGVSKKIIEQIENKAIEYEDATCPFVKKIHDTVKKYSELGYQIIIIGDANHPEVEGILGWSKTPGIVIDSYEKAEEFSMENIEKKICVVSQTTFNYKKFQELVEIISKKGYDILAVNTICNATSTRQKEAKELAMRMESMIVIGGKHSSNSRKLFEICKNQCENTFFIQTADDLKVINLEAFASLGITAGASTPNNIIQEVYEACQRVLRKC